NWHGQSNILHFFTVGNSIHSRINRTNTNQRECPVTTDTKFLFFNIFLYFLLSHYDSSITTRHFTYCLSWQLDRKSTRLNSSHVSISYAVFCLKKKIKKYEDKEANREA